MTYSNGAITTFMKSQNFNFSAFDGIFCLICSSNTRRGFPILEADQIKPSAMVMEKTRGEIKAAASKVVWVDETKFLKYIMRVKSL